MTLGLNWAVGNPLPPDFITNMAWGGWSNVLQAGASAKVAEAGPTSPLPNALATGAANTLTAALWTGVKAAVATYGTELPAAAAFGGAVVEAIPALAITFVASTASSYLGNWWNAPPPPPPPPILTVDGKVINVPPGSEADSGLMDHGMTPYTRVTAPNGEMKIVTPDGTTYTYTMLPVAPWAPRTRRMCIHVSMRRRHDHDIQEV